MLEMAFAEDTASSTEEGNHKTTYYQKDGQGETQRGARDAPADTENMLSVW